MIGFGIPARVSDTLGANTLPDKQMGSLREESMYDRTLREEWRVCILFSYSVLLADALDACRKSMGSYS